MRGTLKIAGTYFVLALAAISWHGQDAEAFEGGPGTGDRTIDFSRDIRSILSNKCFACHGPDANKRQGDLRLDLREGAFETLPSGSTPVVPGDRENSALFARITNPNANERMPPSDSGKTLSETEIDTLGRWIDGGAQWAEHWAFIPPERPAIPTVRDGAWPRNEIDSFILERLDREGIAPSPEADRRTLIRRVSFDLTGLPPTPKEIDSFLSDKRTGAYGRVVDRLLQATRHGEHMARYWLDIARYADTNGYHIDNERYMWRWRDWVIDAFNENMPFDQFTIEQIAGDLLPDPTLGQRIATGFNRNHMVNFEGGAIPEEYRTQYVFDRVDTTSTAWLGLTMGCAQCHEHKFDPISQEEFYKFAAFFNTVAEEGLDGRDGNAAPKIQAPLPAQAAALSGIVSRAKALREEMAKPMRKIDRAQQEWETRQAKALALRWTTLEPKSIASTGGSDLTLQEDGSVLVSGEAPERDVYEFTADTNATAITAIRLEALTDDSVDDDGPGRSENGNFILTEFEVEIFPANADAEGQAVNFATAQADHSQSGLHVSKAIDGDEKTGWSAEGQNLKGGRTAVFVADRPFGFTDGTRIRIRLRQESEYDQRTIKRFRLSLTSDPAINASKFGPWYLNGPFQASDGKAAYETDYGPETEIDLDAVYEDGRQKWVQVRPGFEDGAINRLSGDICATYLYREITAESGREMTLFVGSNDAIKVWLNGRVVHDNNVQRGIERDQDRIALHLEEGQNRLLMKIVNYGNDYAFYFRRLEEDIGEIPLEIELLLAKSTAVRSESDAAFLRDAYRARNSPEWNELNGRLAEVLEEKAKLEGEIPTTMVMAEMTEPRGTFILERGQYDKPTTEVSAGVPASLPPLPAGAPSNRLGLAKWLVDPANPLTARVTVNRFWQQVFGHGLVRTSENFGSQGEWPSHPELLDWLATEFVESGWKVRELMRLMVTSATYRQSSKVSEALAERDPQNILLARAPRYRMDAEMIRDSALAISGLLAESVGGPSVSPYQPPGLWQEVGYGGGYTAQIFKKGEGSELYRRSMYTFWKRTSPPPSMLIFDAPNRETCSVRRPRSNTPLQALTLLNDPQFVEASRALALRMMTEAGSRDVERIELAFLLATARLPKAAEVDILQRIFKNALKKFRRDEDSAKALLAVGDSTYGEKLDPRELAAWTTVASVVLNLDETITKG